ncbi:MAG: hypothetical protein C7B46_20045 [Sulfobacillus benefaciens]|uniref:Uncharacterized protein n=1 Tax=Sulfobacillus benefaciens TaxID=453960 RepID=A0A2T2WVV3_9FIRM|nr:MAG: hypothetical protein C7B46_20045 [Sulfobacillus benefaciens]
MPIITHLDRHVAYREVGGPIVLYAVPDEFIGQEAHVTCQGVPASSDPCFALFLFRCGRCGILVLEDAPVACPVCGSREGTVIYLDPAK